MRFIPFMRKHYETELSKSAISEKLMHSINEKDWKISFDKILNNRVLEGEIKDASFMIVMGKYGLTYGRLSLLPIMKGKILSDSRKGKNIIKIIIRPFGAGLFILGFFYVLALISFVIAIQKRDINLLFFLCVFIGMTYISLMIKYNKEVITYTELIEKKILMR